MKNLSNAEMILELVEKKGISVQEILQAAAIRICDMSDSTLYTKDYKELSKVIDDLYIIKRTLDNVLGEL